MHDIVNYIVHLIGDLGYTGILVMMTIESSFFPFPSEVAMIPAGYLSSTGEMNFGIALAVGTLGALLGASINYLLGRVLGEPIVVAMIHKFGKYIFISDSHYKQAENYFLKHGSITTLLARFIPAVRQLISLPAGTFHMNIPKFLFYTGLGAGIWNLILMTIGYIAGENKELITQYSKEALIVVVIVIIIIAFIYIHCHKYFDKKYSTREVKK